VRALSPNREPSHRKASCERFVANERELQPSDRLMRAMALIALIVPLSAAMPAAGTAGQVSGAAPCASVTLSTGAGGNGMTGGTTAWWVSLTNTGPATCTVQGRPWVLVPAKRYPVKVDDLRAGETGGGSGRTVRLEPGQSARAHVLMMRGGCDFKKSNSATLAVRVGWANRSVTTTGEACLHGGATVAVGPFER
jgi:hypothetical protein